MADLINSTPTQTQDPAPVILDDLLKDRIRKFEEFLDDGSAGTYRHATKTMLDNLQNRLIVNLDDLRDYDRKLADG